jgi:DNA-binding Xre family transcriptional regulator
MSFETLRPAPEEKETIDTNQLALEGRDLAESLGATEQELEAIPNTPEKKLRVEAEIAISRLELQKLSTKARELSTRAQEISDKLDGLLANLSE